GRAGGCRPADPEDRGAHRRGHCGLNLRREIRATASVDSRLPFCRHPSGKPGSRAPRACWLPWTPAFAGVTVKEREKVMTAEGDRLFAGSIPAFYERYMGPMLFEPYAADLAARAKALNPRRLLEVAAGTGIVTRALAAALPGTAIIATDLNQAMLDYA